MYYVAGTSVWPLGFPGMKTLALFLILSTAPAIAQQAPQSVPDVEQREGETLTDRLDRTDGVIKPPPVDTPMPIEPPKDQSNMRVLKPGDAPQQQNAPRDAGK